MIWHHTSHKKFIYIFEPGKNSKAFIHGYPTKKHACRIFLTFNPMIEILIWSHGSFHFGILKEALSLQNKGPRTIFGNACFSHEWHAELETTIER
jgi:hypothetical protein